MEQPVQSSVRRHRRVTFIAPQDREKIDPFAPVAPNANEPSPETPDEAETSNDKRIIENLPPHFGRL